MRFIPPATKSVLSGLDLLDFSPLWSDAMKLIERWLARDTTTRFLWEGQDGAKIESVLIPRGLKASMSRDAEPLPRLTLCISSQAGCAIGCKFCLTGKQGLTRNLSAQEIVSQVYGLPEPLPITNLVFMGMGEPLQNLDNVVQACRFFLEGAEGRRFSRRKILISTSGLVSGIDRLADKLQVRLAVSLNAPTDEKRSEIMPINRKWGMNSLLDSAGRYAALTRMPVMLEYVLLAGFNDALEDAEKLYPQIKDRPFQLNLIPFNEFPGSEWSRPAPDTIKRFQHYFVSRGITATVRASGGQDILAACGQLSGLARIAQAEG